MLHVRTLLMQFKSFCDELHIRSPQASAQLSVKLHVNSNISGRISSIAPLSSETDQSRAAPRTSNIIVWVHNQF